jgi:hypothetical protein
VTSLGNGAGAKKFPSAAVFTSEEICSLDKRLYINEYQAFLIRKPFHWNSKRLLSLVDLAGYWFPDSLGNGIVWFSSSSSAIPCSEAKYGKLMVRNSGLGFFQREGFWRINYCRIFVAKISPAFKNFSHSNVEWQLIHW